MCSLHCIRSSNRMHTTRDPHGFTHASPVETSVPPTPTPTPTTVSLSPGLPRPCPKSGISRSRSRTMVYHSTRGSLSSCQGGKGLNFIQQIDVRITRADGVVENGIITKPLYKGKSVSLTGSGVTGILDGQKSGRQRLREIK